MATSQFRGSKELDGKKNITTYATGVEKFKKSLSGNTYASPVSFLKDVGKIEVQSGVTWSEQTIYTEAFVIPDVVNITCFNHFDGSTLWQTALDYTAENPYPGCVPTVNSNPDRIFSACLFGDAILFVQNTKFDFTNTVPGAADTWHALKFNALDKDGAVYSGVSAEDYYKVNHMTDYIQTGSWCTTEYKAASNPSYTDWTELKINHTIPSNDSGWSPYPFNAVFQQLFFRAWYQDTPLTLYTFAASQSVLNYLSVIAIGSYTSAIAPPVGVSLPDYPYIVAKSDDYVYSIINFLSGLQVYQKIRRHNAGNIALSSDIVNNQTDPTIPSMKDSQISIGTFEKWSGHSIVEYEAIVVGCGNKIYTFDTDGNTIDSYSVGADVDRNIAIDYVSVNEENPSFPGEYADRNIAVLIYTTMNGHIGSVETETIDGTRTWETGIIASDFTSPVIDTDGNIFFGMDSKLYCYDKLGNQSWFYTADGTINDAPTIGDDGNIYFTDDNKFYCLSGTSAPFDIVLTDPLHDATGVSVTGDITITFNSPINASSVTASTLIITDDDDLALTYTTSITGPVLTITPTLPLTSSSVITVFFDETIANTDGVTLGADHRLQFTTAGIEMQATNVNDILYLKPAIIRAEKPMLYFQAPEVIYEGNPRWELHFKLESYKEAGLINLIEDKDTVNDLADFEYSTNNGLTWTAFPTNGLTHTAYRSQIRVILNTGREEDVYIRFFVGANDG